MSDNANIRDVHGEEARLVLAQFLGQQLGELKEIDKSIISRNPTLQGATIDAQKLLRDIPLDRPTSLPGAPSINQVDASLPVVTRATAVAPTPPINNDQIEFDFRYDVAKDIAERLSRVESDIGKILKFIEGFKLPEKKT